MTRMSRIQRKRKGTAGDPPSVAAATFGVASAPGLRKETKRTKALRNQVRIGLHLCFFVRNLNRQWTPILKIN